MKRMFLVLFLGMLAACSQNQRSIYGDLGPEEDGIVDSEIPADNPADDEPKEPEPTLVLPDTLTKAEADIARVYHKNQLSRFSFIILDAEKNTVIRSYHSLQPRRLASVTKIATSITALENIDGANISKVSAMLKSSNNGEASRYLRLAVKTMANYIVPGSGYTESSSCPSTAVKNEAKAAEIMFDWLQSQIPNADWSEGALLDGAGCNYGNFLNALQITQILRFADSKGPVFGGKSFESLLSISGVDGTWAGKNKDHKGQVLAKTGTLNPNANLAGYFYARRDGVLKKYYFAVLVEKDPGSANAAAARTFIEQLVRNWINYFAKQEGEALAQL
ncbi:D-alanyl-D-alanine carboxypeptidase [bacterium]|nr:D-alanyl-D-alanine carboxypeptidase [bacterium]